MHPIPHTQGLGTTIPAKQPNTLQANGTTRANLVLRNLRTVEMLPTPGKATIAAITGLLNETTLTCQTRMGSSSSPFDVALQNASDSTLIASCMSARTLRITNAGGRCVQVWRPEAREITIRGTGSVEVVLHEQTLPLRITFQGVTSTKQSPTRITLRFSTLKTNRQYVERVTMLGTFGLAGPNASWPTISLVGCGVDKVASFFTIDGIGTSGTVDYAARLNVCRDAEPAALADVRRVRDRQPCALSLMG